jgi:LDH2 family malate/lactate/ureidoglycolate dehydrogenase
MLGTNPIAIGFPGNQEPPIVIDMATNAVAYGKVEMARRKGNPIPSGWAIQRHRKIAKVSTARAVAPPATNFTLRNGWGLT